MGEEEIQAMQASSRAACSPWARTSEASRPAVRGENSERGKRRADGESGSPANLGRHRRALFYKTGRPLQRGDEVIVSRDLLVHDYIRCSSTGLRMRFVDVDSIR